MALEPTTEASSSVGQRKKRGERQERNIETKTTLKVIICIDKTKLELIVKPN